MDNNENQNIKKGYKKKIKIIPYAVIIIVALVFVFTLSIASYAYFSASVNKGTINATQVSTGSMEIEFTDGAEVSLNDAIPGQYIEKTFKVKSVGTVDTVYDIYMSDLINDFVDKTDLVYTLTSNDGGANISETQVPDVNTKIVSNKVLGHDEEHNYTLRIEFKETNDNQDDNKGASFSTIIRINEVQAATRQITLNLGGVDNTVALPIGEPILENITVENESKDLVGVYLDSEFTQPVTSSTVMTTSINNIYVKYKPYKTVSGDIATVGSIIKIANEEFYVIGQEDSTHVKLLSKWNLNVGSHAKGTATGLQDSDVRGKRYDGETKYGNIVFSSTNYWHNGSLKSEYGSSYPAYVYTNAKENGTYIASIAEYVDNYVTYLTNQGVNVSGRLISKEELESVINNGNSLQEGRLDNNASDLTGKEWTYQTSYWTGTAAAWGHIVAISSDKYLYHDDNEYNNSNNSYGVRPVIILEK